jgi:sarcosine oxidase
MPGADYPCIVLGVGGVGSAALRHLARRGIRALGIERFIPGHCSGSSHGETRVIRTAYHEHPDHVPLLRRSHALWAELEQESGERLYWETGVLEVGPPDGEVVSGVLQSARTHGLAVDELTGKDVERRFPGFLVPEGSVGVFEQQGGVLAVEDCVRAHARLAVEQGADLWTEASVDGWRVEGGQVVVETGRGKVTGDKLIITAGAWAPELLDFLQIPMSVVRKVLLWHGADPGSYAPSTGSPVFLYERPEGVFYGFPAMEDGLVKVAEHSGGEGVMDPLRLEREVRSTDTAPVSRFLEAFLPAVDPGDVQRSAVCMYTLSPDLQFIVGSHPRRPEVAFAAGLSGHGFKFASALGEALAQWAVDGRSRHSLEVFSPLRFGP